MSNQYHMCNASNGDWAYVSLYYYSTNCTLIRYDYQDPYRVPIFFFYFYFISYYIVIFLLFPLFFFLFYFWLKSKIVRFVSPEGDALIARHPDGYWANAVADNAPFGQFLRRLRG
jgi:hypothetical protein